MEAMTETQARLVLGTAIKKADCLFGGGHELDTAPRTPRFARWSWPDRTHRRSIRSTRMVDAKQGEWIGRV